MATPHRRVFSILLLLVGLSVVFTVALVYNIAYVERPAIRRGVHTLREPRRFSNGSRRSSLAVVSALNQRWMTWQTLESPGKYRACVPYPTPDHVFDRELTGGLVDTSETNMTILQCLHHCINLEYTYAALTKGTQCYCTNVHRSTSLLRYVDSALCDVPCTGDRNYDCGGREYFSLYRTSVPDVRCSSKSVGKDGAFPLTALASYPRSGNTWTRQLIEAATGVYTGSIYWKAERESPISQKVFLGGNDDYHRLHTICVKTHRSERKHIGDFSDAVLLIRNPYRTIVAEVFRRFMFAKSGSVDDSMEYLKSKDWQKFVDKEGQRWHDMNLNWIKYSKRLLVIHYEQLETHTEDQLTRIVQFLRKSPDQERIACSVQDNPSSSSTGVSLGNHGVKTRAYLTTDPFTPSMHTIIDSFILSVNESLIAKGQDPLPSDYSNIRVF
ncbi:sialate:O-sulfotransferase 1-like [Diadema setosum]|uniref:sialate:O-sulfotransferase 1-like n=1 Tax=Diadema setosum TaxID=31175 RepID=UPI003B3A896D